MPIDKCHCLQEGDFRAAAAADDDDDDGLGLVRGGSKDSGDSGGECE